MQLTCSAADVYLSILSAPYVHTLVFTTAKIEMMRIIMIISTSGSGPVMGVVCYTQGSGLESNYFVACEVLISPKTLG